MKAVDLHRNSLIKQIKKLDEGNLHIDDRNVIMRSDSKGRAFLSKLSYRNRINLVFRSGASITAPFMQAATLNKIRYTNKPIVILFFGTCELTQKSGKYIYVPDDIENRVLSVKENYINYKQKVINANPNAIVKFLECPYQSIVIWNFLKGHPHPGTFEKDQKRLEEAIKTLNIIIKEINGDQIVTRISKDQIYSIKKKQKAPIYMKNYGLLRDGVHMNELLTKLWFKRIVRMVNLS